MTSGGRLTAMAMGKCHSNSFARIQQLSSPSSNTGRALALALVLLSGTCPRQPAPARQNVAAAAAPGPPIRRCCLGPLLRPCGPSAVQCAAIRWRGRCSCRRWIPSGVASSSGPTSSGSTGGRRPSGSTRSLMPRRGRSLRGCWTALTATPYEPGGCFSTGTAPTSCRGPSSRTPAGSCTSMATLAGPGAPLTLTCPAQSA
mmetsp:Transcript_35813/g.102311  ORF Transcript_35813/g.102311 Transcript_35813/m.102311 type:complete len:201 (-) Transcript_35813:1141-1743(-)